MINYDVKFLAVQHWNLVVSNDPWVQQYLTADLHYFLEDLYYVFNTQCTEDLLKFITMNGWIIMICFILNSCEFKDIWCMLKHQW